MDAGPIATATAEPARFSRDLCCSNRLVLLLFFVRTQPKKLHVKKKRIALGVASDVEVMHP